ncbi:MAG: protein kinase [Planctomycetes bacterium]|nr:protein kinase [Planctomycetota bacterium]
MDNPSPKREDLPFARPPASVPSPPPDSGAARKGAELLKAPSEATAESAVPTPGPLRDPDLGPSAPTTSAQDASNTPSTSTSTSEFPRAFGRYQLLGRLGAGGMGVVYRARDTQLANRQVALKVLRTELGDAEFRDRFQREVAAMARLRHPNLVPIYDAGTEAGCLFYTMELVSGESLDHTLRREKRLPPRAALSFVRDAARGVQHAHQQGIIHRDLKPGNLLVADPSSPNLSPAEADPEAFWWDPAQVPVPRRRAIVMDFGLARDLAVSRLTRTGAALGTPAYMAPEQVGGESQQGPWTDVYALGATLYELLTGEPPFVGGTEAEILLRVLLADPTSLRTLLPTLHPDVATICEKAMEKDPARRYAGAGALADDIDRHLRGEILVARPASWVRRLRRRWSRHRQMLLPLAVAACVGVLALAASPAQRAWSARIAARARVERERYAAELLRRASEAFDSRRLADAAALAQDLLDYREREGHSGDFLGCEDAHLLLGRIALADSQLGLDARFRAAQNRFVEALRVAPENARTGAAARLGLARCALYRKKFELAREFLDEIQDRSALPDTERAESLLLDRLLARLNPVRLLTGSFEDVEVADLDGDGRPEVVSITGDGREIAVGSWEHGTYRGMARATLLPTTERFGLQTLGIVRVRPGDPSALRIVVGGGLRKEGRGFLSVLRFQNGQVVPVASSTDLPTSLKPHSRPFAIVDGGAGGGDTGLPQLLVGTDEEGAVRIYDLDEAAGRLARRRELSLRTYGGTVDRVLVPTPSGGSGRSAWVFGLRGVVGLRRGAGSGVWEEVARFPFAAMHRFSAPIETQEGEEFLVGAGWWRNWMTPGAEGERAPGVYRMNLRDLEASTATEAASRCLWQEGLQEGGCVEAAACILREGTETFAWATRAAYQSGEDLSRRAVRTRIYRRVDASWSFLTELEAGTGSEFAPYAFDLDGDGNTELIFPLPSPDNPERLAGGLRIFGLGATAQDQPARRVPAKAGSVREAAPDPVRRRLEAARTVEKIGNDAQAVELFRNAAARATDPEERRVAALGLLRALCRMGALDEAMDEFRRVVREGDVPPQDLVHAVLDRLEGNGRWAQALEAGQGIERLGGLDDSERAELRERLGALDRLAHPVADALGEELLKGDLLATSPLYASLSTDSAVRLRMRSSSYAALFLPVDWDGRAYRLSARIEPLRLDPCTGFTIGVVAEEAVRGWFDPAATWSHHRVGLAAIPEAGIPRVLTLDVEGPGVARFRSFGAEVVVLGHPLAVALEYAAHQGAVYGEVGAGVGLLRNERLSGSPLAARRVLLALVSRGTQESAGWWGDARLTSVEFAGSDVGRRPRRYAAESALDWLLWANGRWMQGRREEAAIGYGRAIELDRIEAGSVRARRAVLPEVDPPQAGAGDFRTNVEVDARFWRGLLRAEAGQPAAAAADLLAAARLAPARVKTLLVNHALPLRERPASLAAVRLVVALRVLRELPAGTPVRRFRGLLGGVTQELVDTLLSP